MTLLLKIITPNGIDVEADVDSVVIPTKSGEIEILPGHRSIISILVPGWLILKSQEKNTTYVVDQGFVRVNENIVSITTDEMLNTADVDTETIDLAMKRAEQALEEARNNRSSLDPMEIERLEAKVKYQMAQKLLIDK